VKSLSALEEANYRADYAALLARRERVLAQVHAPTCPGVPECKPKAPWGLCGKLRARLREAFGAAS
jgi:hypothetical protein